MLTRRTILERAALASLGLTSTIATADAKPSAGGFPQMAPKPVYSDAMAAPPPPPPPPRNILSAVVNLWGQSFVFDASTGTDLGDFVSSIGGFTQRCVRATAAGCPLTVFFRPDRNSDRVEVVFELGDPLASAPANLDGYSVSLRLDGVEFATVDVPAHYWFSRWRWQSAERPIVGNVDALESQALLPPLDRVWTQASGLTALAGVSHDFAPYAIMGLADVTPYMPQTGERDDIGLVTEPQAAFICTGDPAALARVRAQAEAASTIPWHVRDAATGAPLDLRAYPTASCYWDSRVADPWVQTTWNPATIDIAHEPALAYLPYLLTGDPYHLEDLQFATNHAVLAAPPAYRLGIGQSRAFAWYLRNLAQCVRITPADVPSWLLPRTYWAGYLDDNRAFLENNYVNGPGPVQSVFRSTGNVDLGRDEPNAPGGTWIDPWQEEFVASVIGWMIEMGFPEWGTAFDWKIGSTLARTGNSSGWPRSVATPYRVILRYSRQDALAGSWGEAWGISRDVAQLNAGDWETWNNPDMTYLAYSRGALVFAARRGVPGAADALRWATDQLNQANWAAACKWRLQV